MNDEHASEQPKGPTQAEGGQALDRLYALLEEQLELVHEGRFSDAENMCERTGTLVRTVVAAGLLAAPAGDDRRESLMQLYQQLCLAVTAQSEEASASLRDVRRGKRMPRACGKQVF